MAKDTKKAGHNAQFISTTEREETVALAASDYRVEIYTRSGKDVRGAETLREAVKMCRDEEVCYVKVRCLIYGVADLDGLPVGALVATYITGRGFKCVEVIAAQMVEAVG